MQAPPRERPPSDLGPRLRIVALATGAAVLYGLLHDQVTVRICLEYFSVFHPPLVDTADPTLLALAWGVAATWWAGAAGGAVLALAARAGRRPRIAPRALVRPVALLLLAMAAGSVLAGLAGNALAAAGAVVLWPPSLADRIPREEHVDFLTCLWAHNAAYNVGFAGTLWIAWRTWRGRAPAAAVPGPG